MVLSWAYSNLCIDYPDVPTCIPPISYKGSYRGMRNRTVCFDYINILYSLSVTTLRNLREIEACLWIVSRCIHALYSAYWLLVMRVFIVWMTKNRW